MSSGPLPHECLFVALDTSDIRRARQLVRELKGQVGGFKIGLELFCSHGPEFVREVRDSGRIFLDLKLHDIPNTVSGAAAAAGGLGVAYFTLHAMGGSTMVRRGVEAAAQAAAAAGLAQPVALAVTVLTSHDDRSLEAIGLRGPCTAAVSRLATLARDGGAGGLVCSAWEIGAARRAFPEATLVVPGIRPSGGPAVVADDQARTATAAHVVRSGADLLVVGRAITQADDPVGAASAIAREIASTRSAEADLASANRKGDDPCE